MKEEQGKTLKELSDYFNVNRDKILYRYKKLPSNYSYKKGNVIYVKEVGIIELSKYFNKENNKEKTGNNQVLTNEEIKEKNKQISELQEIVRQNQKLLDQQQQLHLQANQRIDYLEKQLALDPPKAEQGKQEQGDLEERLKALESENKEYEEANNDFAKVNQQLEEQLEELTAKKWYQFWK